MSLTEWSPFNQQVQGGLVPGQFLSGAYIVIAAGPPSLDSLGGTTAMAAGLMTTAADAIAWPIGLIQNWSMGQNRQHTRFWEIGSERSFSISGRAVGNLNLSRILYHGPSLLRAVYAYYQDTLGGTQIEALFASGALGHMANPHNVKLPPGYENFFCSLASDLFAQPIGLLMMLRDSNEDMYGAMYLENCVVPSLNMATDAQGTIIQENASLEFERATPIAVSALALMKSGATELLGG